MIGHVHPMMGRYNPATPPAFEPIDWFSAAETGFAVDPQDLPTMWQDVAGTVAAVVGQPVARVDCAIGSAFSATQADEAKRPTLRQNGSGKYYLEFDALDVCLVGTAVFGAANTLTTLAGFRNRGSVNLGALLEMVEGYSSGDSAMRIRQRAVGANNLWDALLCTIGGNYVEQEGTSCNAVGSTDYVNNMVMVSQHDIPNDISTITINGVDGSDGLGEKSAGTIGTVTVTIGKAIYRDSAAIDLYGLIVRGTLTTDTVGAEYWMDTAMGGGVMPAYSPPGPDPVLPNRGFATELDNRFPWMAFAQPAAQFTYWSDVGCNVLDSWSPNTSGLDGFNVFDLSTFNSTHIAGAEAWDSAAIAAGFKIARCPYTATRAAADLIEPMRSSLVGWPVPDEPESYALDLTPYLAIFDAADPTFSMPRAMNNTGPQVLSHAANLMNYYNLFVDYPAVQIGFDYYPTQQSASGKTVIPGYKPSGVPYTATHSSSGLGVVRETSWAITGVPTPTPNPMSQAPCAVFIATAGFVETYQTTLRVPTPALVRFQISDAIAMGAEAISFFPQKFEWIDGQKTFTSHNGTPADVKAELTALITRYKLLETGFAANLLVNPATGRIWPATYRNCPDTVPSQVQTSAESGLTFASPPTVEYLPGPFQGSRRVTSIGNVYFIQNMMDEVASLTDAAWGFSAVSFAARETLVFLEADKANAIWSDIDGVLP